MTLRCWVSCWVSSSKRCQCGQLHGPAWSQAIAMPSGPSQHRSRTADLRQQQEQLVERHELDQSAQNANCISTVQPASVHYVNTLQRYPVPEQRASCRQLLAKFSAAVCIGVTALAAAASRGQSTCARRRHHSRSSHPRAGAPAGRPCNQRGQSEQHGNQRSRYIQNTPARLAWHLL